MFGIGPSFAGNMGGNGSFGGQQQQSQMGGGSFLDPNRYNQRMPYQIGPSMGGFHGAPNMSNPYYGNSGISGGRPLPPMPQMGMSNNGQQQSNIGPSMPMMQMPPQQNLQEQNQGMMGPDSNFINMLRNRNQIQF